MKISRIFQRISFYPMKYLITLMEPLNSSKYMSSYTSLLRRYGLNIGKPLYIHKTVKFDDFNKISLGNNCVVSFGVYFLTHDYSRLVGYNYLEKNGFMSDTTWDNPLIGTISVGENSFIGARTLLLPNTSIGKDCIIGAGSVVKGSIPDGSVVVGNPAKVIGSIDDFAHKWRQQNLSKNK